MNVTRFVIIQAISIKGDDDKIELIPFWDGRINYSKSKNEGEFLTLTDRSGSIFDVVECVYDMKNRTVSPGIFLDYYPDEKEIEFKTGEVVFYDTNYGNRILTETKIKEVLFEEYDLDIKRGKRIEKYHLDHIVQKNEPINPETIYALRIWKPTYVLENGVKTKYSYQLYKKAT